MKTREIFLILIILIVCCLGLAGCGVNPQLQDEYFRNDLCGCIHVVVNNSKPAIKQFMRDEQVPGVSVALVDCDGIVWTAGFGYTDRKQKTPVTPETIFAACSISKVITTTAVMLAAQDGAVELDVPIKKYLPAFTVNSRYEENAEEKITLRHLLTHTSGLTQDVSVGNPAELDGASFEDHIRSVNGTWLRHKVGEKILYSNIGMDLAAHILEQQYNKPINEILYERIFEPLGMTDSFIDIPFIQDYPSRAKGHLPHVEKISIGAVNFFRGAGGVFTNVKDLAFFMQFYLNRGKIGQETLLDEQTIDEIFTALPGYHIEGYEERSGQGLGVRIRKTEAGIIEAGHTGSGFGFDTQMYWYPEYGFGCLILANKQNIKGGRAWLENIMSTIVSENFAEKNDVFDRTIWKTLDDNSTADSVRSQAIEFTPYKLEWKNYEGTYRYMLSGYKLYPYARIWLDLFGMPEYEAKVREKDGYLEIIYDDGRRRCEKLSEQEQGLFFTKDGECLDFRGEVVTWRNYRMKKVR